MYLAVAAEVAAPPPPPPEANPAVDVFGVPDDDDDGCFFPSFSHV